MRRQIPIQWSDLVSVLKKGAMKSLVVCPKCNKAALLDHKTDMIFCKNCGFYGTMETVMKLKKKKFKTQIITNYQETTIPLPFEDGV